jgi:glycosyltransferase involved in cell wall biosynthesis
MLPTALSVVVPTYNRAHFIVEAVESILRQVDRSAQIIVVDDGSTDDTPEVLGRFGDRIDVVRQANAGIGAARNAGLARAGGARIAFLDSDDLWTDRHQPALNVALDQNPNALAAFGWVAEFTDGAEASARYQTRTQPGFMCGAMLARRELFDLVGAFRTDIKVGEFIDWMARVRDRAAGTCMVDDVVLLRRVHGQNTVLTEDGRYRGYHAILRDRLAKQREGHKA